MDREDRNEFRQDLEINPGQLDVEAAKQADRFFVWAERAIDAKGDVDYAKLDMEVTEARIQASVRKDPESYGINGKVTEAAIRAAVADSAEFMDKQDRFLEAKSTSALLDKAVQAMDMKKRMIEAMITLHGQQYFAGPSVPRDLIGAWNEHQREQEDRVRRRQARLARRRTP